MQVEQNVFVIVFVQNCKKKAFYVKVNYLLKVEPISMKDHYKGFFFIRILYDIIKRRHRYTLNILEKLI